MKESNNYMKQILLLRVSSAWADNYLKRKFSLVFTFDIWNT
jgi:hypothetical protein